MVLELCCGTAGLTASFKRCGLTSCMAIDKVKSKGAKASITQLDLTDFGVQRMVIQWLHHPAVVGLFWAPPCGTASAARQIELPDEPGPKPLRSILEPDGLEGLSNIDLIRVSQANILYAFCAESMSVCVALGKPTMCENPRGSLFWLVTPWVESLIAEVGHISDHQACAYGSDRPKWTRLVASFPEVKSISATCPGNHKHAAWGRIDLGNKRVFATSLEVHYPTQLCEAISQAFIMAFRRLGCIDQQHVPLNPAAKLISGQQSANNKLQPAVPEYKCKVGTLWIKDACVWPTAWVRAPNHKSLHKISVGAEVVEQLHFQIESVFASARCAAIPNLEQLNPQVDNVQIFGVLWEPEEFCKAAIQREHPLSVQSVLPTELLRVVKETVEMNNIDIAKERLKYLLKWNKRARELEVDEEVLKQGMDPVVSKAVSSKRILLFEEMLRDAEYPDMGVVSELRDGAELTGEVPATGMLPKCFKPAMLNDESLGKQAALVRARLSGCAYSSGDLEVDEQVWQRTMQEVESGWLRGPLKETEIPVDSPVSRRFGLRQKTKVRLIDDYSASNVNACVTTVESPSLHTTDVISALLAMWFKCCEGTALDASLEIRTFDLSSAYRQIALSSSGRDYGFIAVHHPGSGETKFFQALVLPFGAVRSVHSFLRCARAIWFLGLVKLKILWSSFFDDYVTLSRPSLSSSTHNSVKALFKLLGWLFATEGKKAEPFNNECVALGVKFDLSKSSAGQAFVCNTDSKVEELCNDLKSMVEKGGAGVAHARSIQGRMMFADSQLFGRAGKRCMKALAPSAFGNWQKFSGYETRCILQFVDLLQNGPPREIRANSWKQVCIFTDACYEADAKSWKSGVGGVCFENWDGPWEFFSLELLDEDLEVLGANHKKQVIFEAETLAAVMAFMLWSSKFASKRCHLFVDNEGTKFSLISGTSENVTVAELVEQFTAFELRQHCYFWVSRVPSYSNIADAPSRNDLSMLIKVKANDVSKDAARLLRSILHSLKNGGKG